MKSLRLLAALVAAFFSFSPVRADPVTPVPAPGWELKDVDGKPVNFSQFKGKVVVLDFWATWCGPCRLIAPILEEIAEEQAEAVRIVKVDVDNNPELSNRFGIRNIPALLFFKGGELKDQVVGLTSKADLISRLNALK